MSPEKYGRRPTRNKLKLNKYIHKTVNHSKYFKDPKTGVHTNTIEGTWNGIKLGLSPRNRTEKGMMQHLLEYQWRKDNRKKKYLDSISKVI